MPTYIYLLCTSKAKAEEVFKLLDYIVCSVGIRSAKVSFIREIFAHLHRTCSHLTYCKRNAWNLKQIDNKEYTFLDSLRWNILDEKTVHENIYFVTSREVFL